MTAIQAVTAPNVRGRALVGLGLGGLRDGLQHLLAGVRAVGDREHTRRLLLAEAVAARAGVVIDGKRILTNAHLVRYASQVSVQARPGGDTFEAKVAGVGTDVDLAVLTLEGDDFFKKRPALPRSKALPKVQDAVVVY